MMYVWRSASCDLLWWQAQCMGWKETGQCDAKGPRDPEGVTTASQPACLPGCPQCLSNTSLKPARSHYYSSFCLGCLVAGCCAAVGAWASDTPVCRIVGARMRSIPPILATASVTVAGLPGWTAVTTHSHAKISA